MSDLGKIVVLNGAPRSGKSSIAAAMRDAFDEPWINIGVDSFRTITPVRLRPGIGLRPGGERPEIEPVVPLLYGMLYESIASHSRRGSNVVVDVGHHDAYSQPLGILPDVARRLDGLPALLVGVRCPIEVIMQRRDDGDPDHYERSAPDGTIPDAVLRWQDAVHRPGIYDLEVDTSDLSPAEAATRIRHHLEHGPPPTAFARLAEL
jgi:chloramphenicol 3-O phosphotransferase